MRFVHLVFLLPSFALAWSPFGGPEFSEHALSAQELQKIQINAGWPKDEDGTLLFEVSNGLKGPIQCGVANVVLKDGKTVSKVFVPKFAIPGNASRNASMPVQKGSMKSYALSCSCFKKKGADECVNPLKSN
jgi:hypothetical protein